MPRPRLSRWVTGVPKATYFKPQGIPLRDLEEVCLPIEGLEALRLADLEGLTTEAAAVGMGVSRHTFGRVLAEARASVARALVSGSALRIEGGHFAVAQGQDAETSHPSDGAARLVVAVPSQGPSLSAPAESCFGRAVGFMMVNLTDMSSRYVENDPRPGRGRGSGVSVVRDLLASGATVLLAGRLHPKLRQVLSRAGVRIIEDMNLVAGQTVEEVVRRFAAGESDNRELDADGT